MNHNFYGKIMDQFSGMHDNIKFNFNHENRKNEQTISKMF
jgi:hypothetical protein